MATDSYPADGLGGLTITDWIDYFNAFDGGAECYTADSLALTRFDSGNICRVNTGSVAINGYRLRVTAPEDLTCPVPSSGSATYYIVAYYDPNLNVANSDGTAPRPLGPCRLGIYSSTDITAAMSGKSFVLLHRVVRTAGQALTAATVVSHLRFIGGPTIDWADGATVPVGNQNMPRGTIRIGTNRFLGRTVDPDTGLLGWFDPLSDGPWALPLSSAFVTRVGKTSVPRYYRFAGNMIGFQGQVQRTTGNLSTGSTVTLGTIPAGRRPAYTVAFMCPCGGSSNSVQVRINNDSTTDGAILMTDPPAATTWLDLSAISYRIGA